ncbi:MAG: hypothetical protein K2M27_11610 [Muribaculaceae bacterium]|nr:hypothetical protein [Muribaculaceae bacterium]
MIDTRIIRKAKSSGGSASGGFSGTNVLERYRGLQDELFEKVTLSDGREAIRAKYGLFSNEFISALGVDPDSGNSGGGLDEAALADYLVVHGYARKSDIPTLSGYATETWVEGKGYLTEHQDISGKVDKVAGKGLSTNDFTTALLDKLNGIAAGANKYVHPTHTARKIAVAAGLVLSSITVNAEGHVTEVGSKTLTASDIPALAISKITGLRTELDGKASKDELKDVKDYLDSLFTLETDAASPGGKRIRANFGLYSGDYISAKGVDPDSGVAGGGAFYGRLDTWEAYDANAGDVLSATLGVELRDRLDRLPDTVAWGKVTGKPTTIAGYGITDAKISGDVITIGTASIRPLTEHQPLTDYLKKTEAASAYLAKTDASATYLTKTDASSTYQPKGNYLTAHQSIHALTLKAGAFTAVTYNPKTGAATVNIPTTTSHISEGTRLYFTDARAVAALKATTDSLNTAISKKLDTATFTAFKAVFDSMFEKVTENGVTSIKAKLGLWTPEFLSAKGKNAAASGGGGGFGLAKAWPSANPGTGTTDALGLNLGCELRDTLTGHTGDGSIHITAAERTRWNKVVTDFAAITGTDSDTVINKWEEVVAFLDTYTEADTLAGLLGHKADKATTLSGYGITDGVNSVSVTGSGNAFTAASVSGHMLTLTKGATYLTSVTKAMVEGVLTGNVTSHTHSQYVDLTSAQTITGAKTFNADMILGTGKAITFGGVTTKITKTSGQAIHGGADTASATDANLRFGSWYGVGWYPTISNQTVAQGDNAMWLNVRTGVLTVAGAIVKSGGTASQVLMADGTVQPHWKATDVTTATNDTGMITPLAMNQWTAKTYVTALGVSGNYLTWTKNGATNNITVPYATGAGKLTATTPTTLSLTHSETMAYFAIGGNTVSDKPAGVDAFGMLSMRTAGGWQGQLLMSSNTSTGLYWRTAATLSGGWRTVIDSGNYAAMLDGRYMTLNTVQTVSAAKTFAALLTATAGIRIGDCTVTFVNGMLRFSTGIYSEGAVSAKGQSTASGGAGFGLVKSWDALTSANKTTNAISAELSDGLRQRIAALEGKNYLDALTLTATGSGNAVTSVSLSADKRTLTVTKGVTFLTGITKAQVEAVLTGNITSHTHSQYLTTTTASSTYLSKTDAASTYVTLNTGQTITGNKTFNSNIYIGQGHYIYGANETSGAMLFFDGTRTIIGSVGDSSTLATHLRSKTGHLTVGSSNSATYNVLDSGNYASILDSRYYTESEINTKLGSYYTKTDADGRYVNATGDTMTGRLTITGAAADRPLTVRGISGSDGSGAVGDLYLQYGVNKSLFLGNTGAHNISADGSRYTGNAATATNADMLDGIHAVSFEGYYKTTIDASGLDNDTWYPVTIAIGNSLQTRIRIEGCTDADATWNSRSDKGMAVVFDWIVNGSQYGWTNVQRTVLAASFGAGSTGSNCIRGIDQLTRSSNEYVFVRGGAKYDFYISRNIVPVLRTSSFTMNGQTIAPATTDPGAIVRNNALITDNVASATKLQTARTLWGQSFNGTANVSGNMTGVGNITGSGAIVMTANGRLTLNAAATSLELKYANDDTKSVILNGTAFKPFDVATAKLTLGSASAVWSETYSRKYRSDTTLYLHSAAATSIIFCIGDTEKMRLWQPNGYVGIGTTAPAYPLHVSGIIGATGEIRTTSGNAFRAAYGNYGLLLRNDGDNSWFLLTASGDVNGSYNTFRPFRINNATGDVYVGNSRLYVKHGGNVGIGTTAPAYLLDVNGAARVTTLRIGEATISYDYATGMLKFDKGIYSTGAVSSKGASSTSTGGGIIQKVYGSGSLGGTFSDAVLTDTFNAYTIDKIRKDLLGRITTLEGGSALSVVTSGSGNAVTSVTKSGTVVTVTKGSTFALSSGVVTALGTNGNYLTWTKNGAASNITVPYATTASRLYNSTEHTGTSLADFDTENTRTYQGTNDLGDGITYSAILSVSAGHQHRYFQIIGGKGNVNFLRWRTTDAAGTTLGAVRRLLDDGNYASVLDSRYYTEGEIDTKLTNGTVTKLGTATVGGTSKPMYLNAGVPTALSATVGASNRPVYLNAGTITAGTYTFGNASGNAPVSNGTVNTNLNADMLDGFHISNYQTGGWNTLQAYNPSADTNYARYSHRLFVLGSPIDCILRFRITTDINYPSYGEWILRVNFTTGYGKNVILTPAGVNSNGHNLTVYVDSDYGVWVQTTAIWSNSFQYRVEKGTLPAVLETVTGTPPNVMHTLVNNGSVRNEVAHGSMILQANAATATKLQTARTINGTNFDGSANITTASWGTARSIGIVNSDGTGTAVVTSVNGSANINLKLPATIKAALTGNATTATTLQTARTIWGQSFNGGANVSGNMTGVGDINTASAPIGTIHASNWFRSTGSTGWCSATYGGGWYMTDSTWIRTFGSKSIYQNAGVFRTDGQLQVGAGGATFIANNATGYVGIGNTSPAVELDVCGNVRVSSSVSAAGGDVSLQLWRGTNASWRFLNSGGTLKVQSNYTTAVTSWFDCVTVDYNTGHLLTKGELRSKSANAFRAAYGNYGFIVRNDGDSTYFLLTASGSAYGTFNSLRPFRLLNSSGDIYMGNGSLVVQHNGNVGLSTTNPLYKLHVAGTAYASSGFFSDGYVSAKGQSTTSDIRLKRILRTVRLDIRDIARAPSVEFEWRKDGARDVGSVAQYWERLMPRLVNVMPDGMKGLQYGKAALLGVIAVARETESLRERCARLESRVRELEEKLK